MEKLCLKTFESYWKVDVVPKLYYGNSDTKLHPKEDDVIL